MTVRYADYVHIDNIILQKDETKICRYLLECSLEDGEEKSALVIMKNPSKAMIEESDLTVNAVLAMMHYSKYSKVYITNLIPIYGTKPRGIAKQAETESSIYPLNDKIISECADKADSIYVGWGNSNGIRESFYKARISSVAEILRGKQVYCYGINVTGYPVHPSRNQWNKRKKRISYNL